MTVLLVIGRIGQAVCCCTTRLAGEGVPPSPCTPPLRAMSVAAIRHGVRHNDGNRRCQASAIGGAARRRGRNTGGDTREDLPSGSVATTRSDERSRGDRTEGSAFWRAAGRTAPIGLAHHALHPGVSRHGRGGGGGGQDGACGLCPLARLSDDRYEPRRKSGGPDIDVLRQILAQMGKRGSQPQPDRPSPQQLRGARARGRTAGDARRP